MRSRPSSSAMKARARRPLPTTPQTAPLAAMSNSSPAGHDHRVELPDRPPERALVEPGEQVDASEDGGVGHEEAISAIAAAMLTVAWAVTDAQYPRQR